MPNKAKKLAAALAAVEQYLEQEAAEQAATEAAQLAASAAAMIPPRSEPGAWAQSARVDMMAGRRLIQLRAFANRC